MFVMKAAEEPMDTHFGPLIDFLSNGNPCEHGLEQQDETKDIGLVMHPHWRFSC